MRNSSTLRQGSLILAAKFLEEFAGVRAVGARRHGRTRLLEALRATTTRPRRNGYGRLIAELARGLA
jgi:hypothetical protein